MTTTTLKAPFPYFGGKRAAAPLIWDLLGDPGGYVEPFAGSAAVFLARPAFTGLRVETLNDADGWLANVWRAIQLAPEEVAMHCYGPVSEIDYHARLAWLQSRRGDWLPSWLEGDPEAHDPKAAGWWLYVAACGIGDPWGPGHWIVRDGHLVDKRKHVASAGRGVNRALPHLGNAGQGVNRALPHLGDAGKHEEQVALYLSRLASRLERVRITCGSWERVVKPSGLRATAGGDGTVGVFLDPPYATSGDLYAETNAGTGHDVAHDVNLWCRTADPNLRIVLCGYDNEHDHLLGLGWRVMSWKSGGGYGGKESDRERLWISPACISAGEQQALDFGGDAA